MSLNNNDNTNSRNMVIAMLLFVAVMFGYNYFFEQKPADTESQEEKTVTVVEKSLPEAAKETDSAAKISYSEAVSKKTRVFIENGKMIGSVDLNGAILDNITLKNYKKTTEPKSENVDILTPAGTDSEYYYVVSYKDKTNNEILDEKTVWSKEKSKTTNQSIVLKTRTSKGLIIERTITLDDGYMINTKDKVINVSDKEISISKAADLVRANPAHHNYAVVHEGLIGNADGKVEDFKYSSIDQEKTLHKCSWLGYTDIYWLCSIINKDKNSITSYSKIGDDSYRCSVESKADIKIPADSAVEFNYSLFAGPKDVKVLRGYADTLKIDKFDMAIDYGWFSMLTKPLLQLLDLLAGWFNNMGLVILFLTLLFKVVTYPLMKKSFNSAAKMRELQPKVAAIQKSYAHDKVRMNQEMMALYKKEKVSPMSGCLPMILQAPIFFCLYKVFFISIEMRHAPLFGWIQDLSAPDSLYIVNLFGAIDWTPPSILQVGVWPLIMGVTMFLQQKLSSSANKNATKTSEAKMQENMMMIMPVMFTYICSSFPVGVVIYWTISNIFSMAQQYHANTHVRRKK